MSCIKFPSSKTDLLKPSNKENTIDYNKVNSQLIGVANEVFGEGKWSHSINNQTLDYIEYVAGKYHAGCSSVVRVQLQNGNFHENVGYSCTEGSSKGSAIQKARLGSCNGAFKKALMCFGKDITNKIKKSPSRPSSPMQFEAEINKFEPPKCLPEQDNAQSCSDTQKTAETFENYIPMSQAEALMDIAAFNQIFDKDQNSNTLDSIKSEKDMKNPVNNVIISKEPQVSVSKLTTSTITANVANVINKQSKVSINIGSKRETKTEVPKPVVSTAMAEEEMRLERKRKQREMQEEFKRKEESKKKMGDNGSKPTPNPRY